MIRAVPSCKSSTLSKTAGNILPLCKLKSRFAVAKTLKEQSANVQSYLFCTKIAKLGIQLRQQFCTLITYDFFCYFTAHLTFQMRNISVTKNSNQTTRHSLPGTWTAWHETRTELHLTLLCTCMHRK